MRNLLPLKNVLDLLAHGYDLQKERRLGALTGINSLAKIGTIVSAFAALANWEFVSYDLFASDKKGRL